MDFTSDDDIDLTHFYLLFASVFMQAPDAGTVQQIEEIFSLKFQDTEEEIRTEFKYLLSPDEGRFPPFESLYNYPLWDKPQVLGKASAEVQQFYEAAGIPMDEETELIPDHLSAELLFMSYLIGKGMIELQQDFMLKHLAIWVPHYCDEVQNSALTSFYQQVPVLLKEFILEECQDLDID